LKISGFFFFCGQKHRERQKQSK